MSGQFMHRILMLLTSVGSVSKRGRYLDFGSTHSIIWTTRSMLSSCSPMFVAPDTRCAAPYLLIFIFSLISGALRFVVAPSRMGFAHALIHHRPLKHAQFQVAISSNILT